MSRLRSTKEVAISSLHLPGGWRQRLDPDQVTALRDEIQAGRVLPPARVVTFRLAPGQPSRLELVQGFHRLAAHMEAGVKKIRCDVVTYDSAEEREVDQLSENLKRRILPGPERDRALHRLVELHAQIAAAGRQRRGMESAERGAIDRQVTNNSRGRPPSDRRAGIQKAASDTGLSESTVERSHKRIEADAQKGAEGPDVPHGAPNTIAVIPPPPPPPIRTFGVPLAAEVLALVVSRQEHIDKASRLVTQAVGELTRLKAQEQPGEHVFGQLHEELASVGRKLRLERPAWSCPFCKGQLDLPCMSCKGVRYWTEGQARGTDIDQRYLLEGDDAHVSIRGNPVPLARWRATEAPEIRDVGNGR